MDSVESDVRLFEICLYPIVAMNLMEILSIKTRVEVDKDKIAQAFRCRGDAKNLGSSRVLLGSVPLRQAQTDQVPQDS
jgi:hypothetical protein